MTPPTRQPGETRRQYERRLRAAGLSKRQAKIEASKPPRRGLLWWLTGRETKG